MIDTSHATHARSDSDTSSSGSAYQLILDHILTEIGHYEIPLRTMYTLNCGHRGQNPPRSTTPSSTGSSPINGQFAWQDEKATQTFQESLMSQLTQLPTQPTSLPPSFIISFVKRCFPLDLLLVDFPQALTGLDYLKDLETRRRREVAAAMARLDIDSTMLGSEADLVSSRYLGLAQWVNSIEEKERKVEAQYTQLYVGLRRWILINEMSLLPFNKHNCVAMLNTLYPPVVTTPPTSKLTAPILKNQRHGFFKYIQSVERNGTRVLGTIMQQGMAAGDENGWAAVARTLAMYLQTAHSIIRECGMISKLEDVLPRKPRGPADAKSRGSSRKNRKADSGVSLDQSTASPNQNDPSSPSKDTDKPSTALTSPDPPRTAFGKLARGLRTITRSHTTATEMVPAVRPPPPSDLSHPDLSGIISQKPKTLRKMRSMGDVRHVPSHHHSNSRQLPPLPTHRPSITALTPEPLHVRNHSDTPSAIRDALNAASNVATSGLAPPPPPDFKEIKRLRERYEWGNPVPLPAQKVPIGASHEV